MRIRPLKSVTGDYGSLRRGRIAEVEDHLAERLIRKGLAVPYVTEAAGTATENPRQSGRDIPAGGQTGKAKQSASLQADPAPEKRRSRKRGAAAGS